MEMVVIWSLMVLVSLYPRFQYLLLCMLPLCQLIMQHEHFPLKQKLTTKASLVSASMSLGLSFVLQKVSRFLSFT